MTAPRRFERSLRAACIALGAFVSSPSAAVHAQSGTHADAAEGPRGAESTLREAHEALASHASKVEVERAIGRLLALDAASLSAIEARAVELARTPPTGDAGFEALARFRDAAPVGADGTRDLLAGVPIVLSVAPRRIDVALAERVVLMRALERIDSPHALVVAYRVMAADMAAFRSEARQLFRRHGRSMTAALILAGSHPSHDVRLFADYGLASLGITNAIEAIRDQSPESIAEILLAYSTVKHMDAMPTVVSLVGDSRAVVRDAAREAMRSYAENGIWQLRLALESRAQLTPRQGAGHRELLRVLTEALDARREAPVREAVARAVAAAAHGDLAAARREADAVLVADPNAPSRERLASVYAALAEDARSRGAHDDAAAFLRRALFVAPADSNAPTWREASRMAERAALARRGAPFDDVHELAPETPKAPLLSRTRLAYLLGLLAFLLAVAPIVRALVGRVPFAQARRRTRALLARVPLARAVEHAHALRRSLAWVAHRSLERIRASTRQRAGDLRVLARDASENVETRFRDHARELVSLANTERVSHAIRSTASLPQSLAKRVAESPVFRVEGLRRQDVAHPARTVAPRSTEGASDVRGRAELAAWVRDLAADDSCAGTVGEGVERAEGSEGSERRDGGEADEVSTMHTPGKRRARPTRRAVMPAELLLGAATTPRKLHSK